MTQLVDEISNAENLMAFGQALIEVLVPIFAKKFRYVDLVFPIRVLVTDGQGYVLELCLESMTTEPMVLRKDNPEGISDQQMFWMPYDLIVTDGAGRKEKVSVPSDFLGEAQIMHYDRTVN